MMLDLMVLLSAKAFDVKVDLKFYIILVALAVAVIVICCLFAKSEKFKIKKEMEEQKNETYDAPTIIRIKEKND